MAAEFFPQRPEAHPTIYAYEDLNPRYKGLLKVGYTEIGAEKRVAQQYPTKRPDGLKPYRIVLSESAMRPDGTCFTDREVHAVLKKRFRDQISQDTTEFFRCTADDVAAAILAVRTGTQNLENRTQSFGLRPEQREAIDKAMEYYASAKEDRPDRTPKFLWNAKMRFGKTFAAYKLAQKLGCTKVLVLTFKPAVEAAWEEDLMTHIDFEGWQFICRDGLTYEQADKTRPFVCFGSFQDYLGTNENGGIKAKNEWVHTTNWDLVIFDEYHFGAWRENAKKLFEIEDEDENYDFDAEKYKLDEADNAYNETFLPITTSRYLFLSGTPFRALNSGEFIEEQIYNWTYSDEQRAKEAWGNTPDNPYRALPRMVLLTYKIPEEIRRVAEQGEFNEFDLNVFFSAKVQQKGKPETAKFVYENEVQKWLDLIRGAHLPASMDDLRLGRDKRPPMPYSDGRLLNVLSHTLWFMPNVASCFAMANLLKQRQNTFYHDYKINVCAGTKAGIGVDALAPVQASMGDPLETKTITLSCGKLTTGVTVRPWTGIFMLRNLKSPETYFQAAFRVQSPWEITTGAGTKEIMKHECYVFDFALDRALKQISSYSIQLHPHEANPEKSVAEFINFLPVLAYDGSSMKQVDAQDILDIAMAGTSATLLAKRWQSALLVNVDNETLVRLMANEEAMAALMKIEGFRSLNADIETIINKSESVKKAKEKGEKLTPKEKKEISDEEKEFKSKRKEIQEKLIKFATRVPIFMYLTDYRERSLKDVITQLEPGLFKKVTGLDVKDFELLVSLNVFNSAVMNPAVYNFKRYEDASLSYTGVDRHEGEDVGGWDTVIKRKEYETLFYNQQATMKAAAPAADDLPDKPYIFEPDEDELEPEPIKPKKKGKKQADVITYTLPVEKPATHVAESKASTNKTPVTPIMATKPSAPDSRTQKPSLDTSGYSTGVKINHKKFGNGVIVDMKESDNGPLITVRFNAGGIKTLSLTIVLENHVIEKL